MHNPFALYRVTDRWRAGHQAVDYGMDEGTPFGSPSVGVYRHDGEWDDAGVRGSLLLPDGSVIRFCHLLRHVAADGARVAEGQTLAESGNTGTSTGPHMHTYGLTPKGQRWNWTIQATAAGVTPPRPFLTPATDSPEEDNMATAVITVGIDQGAGQPNQYWSMNLADHTVALLRNGDQLDFRRNIGVPEYINQAPSILEGYVRVA